MLNKNEKNQSNPSNPSWIFTDRPVADLAKNLLWADGDVVRAQIDNIANRIVESVLMQTEVTEKESASLDEVESWYGNDSLTFAVHGPWGSGKTSFVKMVLSQINQTLGEEKDRLLECYYQASAFEGTKLGAKASLALQILLTLANQDRQRAIKVFKEALDQSCDQDGENRIDDLHEMKEAGRFNSNKLIALESQYLEDISRLSALTDFCGIIQAELSAQGITQPGQHRTMVVVVDDLDRCSSEFTSSVLEIIQQWSVVNNLYFILAVDRAVLNLAIAERHQMDRSAHLAKITPEVALEKYVQYSVDIHELNEKQVQGFINKFLESFGDSTIQLFKENSDLVARGLRVRTPRGIKKCLNTIRPSLIPFIEGKSGKIQEIKNFRFQLKERLLEYTWRNFYRDFYLPGKNNQNQFSLFIVAIEQACVEYEHGKDNEQLEFSLNRICSRFKVPSETIPLDSDFGFVRFLALRPWLILTDETLRLSLQNLLAGIVPVGQPEEAIMSAKDLLGKKSPIKQIEEYLGVAREAYSQDDLETVVECAIEGRDLAKKQFDAFTPAEVFDFGNLGLYVELIASRMGNSELQELSLELFQIAYKLNPGDIKYALNFVSFMLDAQHPPLENLYPLCREILRDEQRYTESDQYSRYLTYKARFEWIENSSSSNWQPWIEKLLELIEEGTKESNTAFTRLASFYSETNNKLDNKFLKKGAKIYIPRALGQDRELAMLVYADQLGNNTNDSENSEIREAFEIYKYLLRPTEEGGIQDTRDKNSRGNAFHNFAIGLKRVGYLETAGHCWYQSYQLLRGKSPGKLIQNYAGYLRDECNRPDLAVLVENQEVLTEEVVSIQQDGKTMPENFVEGGIQAIFDI